MSGRFNLNDYVTVDERIDKFWEQYPDGAILTDIAWVTPDGNSVAIRATVHKHREQPPSAQGIAQEERGPKGANQGCWWENGETSAIGRALANLGMSLSKNRASREEMAKAERQREAAAKPTLTALKRADAPGGSGASGQALPSSPAAAPTAVGTPPSPQSAEQPGAVTPPPAADPPAALADVLLARIAAAASPDELEAIAREVKARFKAEELDWAAAQRLSAASIQRRTMLDLAPREPASVAEALAVVQDTEAPADARNGKARYALRSSATLEELTDVWAVVKDQGEVIEQDELERLYNHCVAQLDTEGLPF